MLKKSHMLEGTGIMEFIPDRFELNSVENMTSMFQNCLILYKVILPASNSSNLKDISYMFSGCESLYEVNIASLNTINVENMKALFQTCVSLENLILGFFDTSKVIGYVIYV